MSAQSDKIGRELAARVDGVKAEFAARLLTRLQERTPVRTGYTRSRWKVAVSAAGELTVENDQGEVVLRLNDGTSRQAPRGFIELAIAEVETEMQLELGRPVFL